MNVALRMPAMSRDEFLDWAEAREGRYEFDGFEPVGMVGGSRNHSHITLNIHVALRSRLRGSPCDSLGPDMGIATVGDSVRFPDALVTCTNFPGNARLAPEVTVVFEVVSPGSVRVDRIVKLREYQAVASIRRYVIVEQDLAGLSVYFRQHEGDAWTAVALTDEDVLALPEIGIEVPVAEFYEGVTFEVPA